MIKMDNDLLKTDLIPPTNVDFKKLSEDIKKGKGTIRIISCGLCNYDCKNCGIGHLWHLDKYCSLSE